MISEEQEIVDAFHKLYFDNRGRTWSNTYWIGVPIEKCPFDLHIYQEIIAEIRPNIIIETGTAWGGSALFLANMCDILKCGDVVTIEIDETYRGTRNKLVRHPRINYIEGNSISLEVIKQVENLLLSYKTCMVILDSAHNKNHVYKELELYSRYVTKGSYLIVEDGCISGHPLGDKNGDGPYEAIEEFIKTEQGKKFAIDKLREKFFMTYNPNGYLKKTEE